jgi:hypothetical protein
MGPIDIPGITTTAMELSQINPRLIQGKAKMISLRRIGQNRQHLALINRSQTTGGQGTGLLRGRLEDGGLGDEEVHRGRRVQGERRRAGGRKNEKRRTKKEKRRTKNGKKKDFPFWAPDS